ncbi:hypothetical protein B484DRAFT_400944 [Ochromonadaceae sp. CCMP2298]|nr:hypothetical protein B484DRAFT_400944 [Ochromonadaceae sp. CCMP2298]
MQRCHGGSGGMQLNQPGGRDLEGGAWLCGTCMEKEELSKASLDGDLALFAHLTAIGGCLVQRQSHLPLRPLLAPDPRLYSFLGNSFSKQPSLPASAAAVVALRETTGLKFILPFNGSHPQEFGTIMSSIDIDDAMDVSGQIGTQPAVDGEHAGGKEVCIYRHRCTLEEYLLKSRELNMMVDEVGHAVRALRNFQFTSGLGVAIQADRQLDAITHDLRREKAMFDKLESEAANMPPP